jgi:arsenate reductase-like glutaredoxin family protein
MTTYTDEEVVRCIELCEELIEQLVSRVNTTRKRLNKLNVERVRRDLQAAVDAGKENA